MSNKHAAVGIVNVRIALPRHQAKGSKVDWASGIIRKIGQLYQKEFTSIGMAACAASRVWGMGGQGPLFSIRTGIAMCRNDRRNCGGIGVYVCAQLKRSIGQCVMAHYEWSPSAEGGAVIQDWRIFAILVLVE